MQRGEESSKEAMDGGTGMEEGMIAREQESRTTRKHEGKRA